MSFAGEARASVAFDCQILKRGRNPLATQVILEVHTNLFRLSKELNGTGSDRGERAAPLPRPVGYVASNPQHGGLAKRLSKTVKGVSNKKLGQLFFVQLAALD
jgi:hypothetical protein